MSETIRIDHQNFFRLIKIFDRSIGTIEPAKRKIYFYTDQSKLMAYGSDGCLTTELEISNGDLGEKFYIAPLDDLKMLLSREKDEIVEMKFDSTLQISKGTEILSILHPFGPDPRVVSELSASFKVGKVQFRNAMDIGSILLREGQNAFLGSRKGKLFSLSEDHGHIGIAFMDFEGEKFEFEIPYESIRHAVKVFEILKSEKLNIGYDHFFEIDFDGGKMRICNSPSYGVSQKIDYFMDSKTLDFEVQVKALKEGASLCANFQRRNGGMGYIEFSDKMRLGVTSQSSAYEYTYPIMWGGRVRIQIIPRKIQQFFSRIGEKYVGVGISDEYVIFKGIQTIFAIKR